ncbi:cytochrome c maturation protein CcmE [Pajaroellobacter abortibovis]|uniref:Cytochrome c biogenesis protein CcmE n=1 Tax=Pajaroellobacter abortibovis TaxID=1882918 RepID=A0A1L6MUS3_9BACT|nr:cytochrome c maturation protein CcmE [Pajaroellobacter abortibovis]APR99260.1 hypothetical protein BCY86_00155 [Pajaroellobacter abortibovis]
MKINAGECRFSKRGLGVVIALAMAGATMAALVLYGIKGVAIYSKPVDEFLSQQGRVMGRAVRVEGNLVHGSLQQRVQPCEYRFLIEKNGTELAVHYPQCVIPDTLRDVPQIQVGVTVEGKLQQEGFFLASSVLAKCPSKYEMKEREQRGDRAPHSL